MYVRLDLDTLSILHFESNMLSRFIFIFQVTKETITEYFGKFGEVASVNLKMDQMTGRSRGFAFVVFVEVDTLTTVLSQDHAIKGKKVAVKKVIIFYKN